MKSEVIYKIMFLFIKNNLFYCFIRLTAIINGKFTILPVYTNLGPLSYMVQVYGVFTIHIYHADVDSESFTDKALVMF